MQAIQAQGILEGGTRRAALNATAVANQATLRVHARSPGPGLEAADMEAEGADMEAADMEAAVDLLEKLGMQADPHMTGSEY